MSRLFRNAHHHGFWPQQLAVAWDRLLIAEPEGPSFISRRVTQHRLDRRYSCRKTHYRRRRSSLLALPYSCSINSSALSRIDVGTSRPSALAVVITVT